MATEHPARRHIGCEPDPHPLGDDAVIIPRKAGMQPLSIDQIKAVADNLRRQARSSDDAPSSVAAALESVAERRRAEQQANGLRARWCRVGGCQERLTADDRPSRAVPFADDAALVAFDELGPRDVRCAGRVESDLRR